MQTFLHTGQSQTPSLAVRLDGVNVKARAIVFDGTAQYAILPADSNPYSARLCMFRGVGQGFLDDAVEGNLGGAGEPPGKRHLDMDGQIGAL